MGSGGNGGSGQCGVHLFGQRREGLTFACIRHWMWGSSNGVTSEGGRAGWLRGGQSMLLARERSPTLVSRVKFWSWWFIRLGVLFRSWDWP